MPGTHQAFHTDPSHFATHKWLITLPEKGIELYVTPLVPNQEHTHSFTYWEGAARFKGDEIQGLGYIELTGY